MSQNQNQSLNEILLAQKLDHDAETVEKMLNEVMNRMLNMHPSGLNADLNKSNNFIDYSKILKTFQITSNYLNGKSIKNNLLSHWRYKTIRTCKFNGKRRI